MLQKITLILGYFFLSAPVFGASPLLTTTLPLPSDFSKVEIDLVTVDVGKEIFMRGGHTLLRVKDNGAGTDWVFNWGVFDYDDPSFLAKFLQGILEYRLDIVDHRLVVRYFEQIEKRRVWLDRLQLSTKQKERLVLSLVELSKPENRSYPYDIWTKNCSTQVRDVLDSALKHGPKNQLSTEPTKLTYRTNSRINLAPYPPLDALMDLLLNNHVEAQINAWENAYLPLNLRQYFNALPAFDDTGAAISGKTLFAEPQTAVVGNSMGRGGFGYLALATVFWLSALVVFFFNRRDRLKATRRAIGMLTIFGGALGGALSIVMLLAWGFSEHSELHRNFNLWTLWPLDLTYVALGFTLLKSPPGRFLAGKGLLFFRTLSGLHVISCGVLAVISIAGLNTQSVWPTLLLFGPIYLLVYLSLGSNVKAIAVGNNVVELRPATTSNRQRSKSKVS